MRYFKLHGGNGYTGCDFTEYIALEDDKVSEKLLLECDDEFAYDHAKSHEYVALGWKDDWCDETERENYYADAWCIHEEITEEEYNEEVNG